jgi:acyl-[acyl-carrier-protein] desaturase
MLTANFVNQIFKIDPSEMMLAFQYMMKAKIMPAHFLRESGAKISSALSCFLILHSALVFILPDYVEIMQKLTTNGKLIKSGLTDEAEKHVIT